ncbi:MAG: hypothetical protein ACYDIE_09455, partial [Candidatus Krumholzibacteriia bacterium]
GAGAPARHPLPPAGPRPAAARARVSFRAEPARAGARPAWTDLDLRAESPAAGSSVAAAAFPAAALTARLTALTANRRAAAPPAAGPAPTPAAAAAVKAATPG